MKLHDQATTTLVKWASTTPKRVLISVFGITFVSLFLAGQLKMRLNFKDLLPPSNPAVQTFQDVQDRFGEPNLVIAVEGERERTAAMAEILLDQLSEIEGITQISAKAPHDFLRHHAFVLQKPNRFYRSLKIFQDRSLTGSLRGMNDDLEREYSDSDDNLKRDELMISRNIMGLHRSLEILRMNLTGKSKAPGIGEAVDAFTLGEPFVLSLDRSMLLISIYPAYSMADDIDQLLELVDVVESITDEVEEAFPYVDAHLTGLAKIAQDEMNSIGFYTQLLSIGALILIYLLLVLSFRSWVYPLLTLLPLIAGICWTLGALYIFFGSLNLFTAMILLVLLGLGIDFSIHLASRFREVHEQTGSIEDALNKALKHSGSAIVLGAVTTMLAFLTLGFAETRGIHEFGVASGVGVLMTLIAVLVTLPSLLVVHTRKYRNRDIASIVNEPQISNGFAFNGLGTLARFSYKYPVVVLVITLGISGFGIYLSKMIDFEYDLLEMEPAGLKSVELQRSIPDKFGTSEHAAWLVSSSIEESRELKELLRKKPMVGEVIAISDFIPSEKNRQEFEPHLKKFRTEILKQNLPQWKDEDLQPFVNELERLWDNLDMISNQAFTAGLDRIVAVIDDMTGLDSEQGIVTDSSAVLPSLVRILGRGLDRERMTAIALEWGEKMTTNVYSMSDPSPVEHAELPDLVKNALFPSEGDGYLIQIFPRKYLYERSTMELFSSQMKEVHENITGTEQLFILLMDKTREEGKVAAIAALTVIAILMVVYFRSLKGLLAIAPLVVAISTLFILMKYFGMTYNYMNLIAVPIILGIGIDDGIHALHRYREEAGEGEVRVYNGFRFVGRSILLTSITTMIGFGSVGFYEMRGMASFGQVLFMGVGHCFLATIFVIPALVRFLPVKSSVKDVTVGEE